MPSPPDALIVLLLAVFLVELVYALWCAWDMRREYGRRLMDSVLWDRLIRAETRTVAAGLLIGPVSAYALVRFALFPEWPPVPAPWGALAVIVGLILLFWGPIEDRRALKRIQRGVDE